MITLVIPTFKRPEFIVRTLDYYAAAGFRGVLLVGDSSEGEAAGRARAAVDRLGEKLRITYVDCRGLDDRLSLHKLSTMVDTPYAAYLGDDDILVPAGIDRCVRFLEENPSFVAANGRAWTFEVQPGPAYGRVRVFAAYPQPEILLERSRDRLEALLRDYRVTLFSVHRSHAWKEMWQYTPSVPDRTFAAELLPACLSPVLGKMRHLDCFYLLRQGNNVAQYKLPQIADWMATDPWRKSMDTFCQQVADTIDRIDRTPGAGTRAHVEALLERWYLPRFIAARRQAVQEPRTLRGTIRRTLKAIPGVHRLVLASVRWYWQLRAGGWRFGLDAMHFKLALVIDRVTGGGALWPHFAIVRAVVSGDVESRHALDVETTREQP